MSRALTALTIGPLDPQGRDGVLVDVKAFSALGLHAAAAVTSIGNHAISPSEVDAQVSGVLSNLQVDVVKLTCPPSSDVLEAVAAALSRHDVQTLVIDPSVAANDAAVRDVLRSRLLPLALVAVLNATEASALTGREVASWENLREAARAVAAMGPPNVAITDGKRLGELVTDLLFDGADFRDYTAERVQLADVQGAGTTFVAAVAATLAKGETVQHSIAAAKAYVTKALQQTYDLGGAPALHHFYRYWQPSAPAP